ncbi:hypothetical protein TH61_17070 [Rufibacter sp. DG15C]|uniref:hypothetical protein n=1 Tax=Rufibacter sp. DG15C TaxID=1379909 RepID=UPI00078C37EF|nr:hypothetical protein [Rufibacter sp. DG15C]AMM52552.1 hypothetical protein TH61_17070 [Rufibacter sp. DG15C]
MNPTTALLLQGILHCAERDEEVPLYKVLAFFDYVNHSLPTYQEFKESMQRAINLGLIEIRDGDVQPSISFKIWRESKPDSLNLHQERNELTQFLSYQPKLDAKPVFVLVTEREYQDALEMYHRKKE